MHYSVYFKTLRTSKNSLHVVSHNRSSVNFVKNEFTSSIINLYFLCFCAVQASAAGAAQSGLWAVCETPSSPVLHHAAESRQRSDHRGFSTGGNLPDQRQRRQESRAGRNVTQTYTNISKKGAFTTSNELFGEKKILGSNKKKRRLVIKNYFMKNMIHTQNVSGISLILKLFL